MGNSIENVFISPVPPQYPKRLTRWKMSQSFYEGKVRREGQGGQDGGGARMASGPTFSAPLGPGTSTGWLHVSPGPVVAEGQLSSVEPLEGKHPHPRCCPDFSGGGVLGQKGAGCGA